MVLVSIVIKAIVTKRTDRYCEEVSIVDRYKLKDFAQQADMKRKTLSQTLITAAKELGFNKATVAELEQLDIPQAKMFSPKQIKQIRDKVRVSQGVFAALLNVNPSTVQKWEQGKVKPQNAALRLLNIIDAKGIDVLK